MQKKLNDRFFMAVGGVNFTCMQTAYKGVTVLARCTDTTPYSNIFDMSCISTVSAADSGYIYIVFKPCIDSDGKTEIILNTAMDRSLWPPGSITISREDTGTADFINTDPKPIFDGFNILINMPETGAEGASDARLVNVNIQSAVLAAQNATNAANTAAGAANTAKANTEYGGASAAYWGYYGYYKAADAVTAANNATNAANSVVTAVNNSNTDLSTKISNVTTNLTNALKSVSEPEIKSVKGLNNATCTNNGQFTVVISAKNATQFRANIDAPGGAWGASKQITVNVPPGMHTIYVQAKNNDSAIIDEDVITVFGL